MVILLLFLGILGSVNICTAGDESIRAEIAELKARVVRLEEKLAEQEEKTESIEKIDEYKKVNSLKAKSEEHLEAYYSFKVNDHLTLSPDFQVIWDPYGGDATNGDKAIVVGGLRTQVDF